MDLGLQGKTTIVTGASGVIGRGIVQRFTEEGIFNSATGHAFRDNILANGGAEDALVLFRRFRGRDPQVAALLRQAGLIT